ncbi:MAG: hypothetical protein WB613_08885 [Pseudolabrys sp.]
MSEQTNPIEPMSSYQLTRWARQERSALMADYVRSAAFHLTSSLGSYVQYFAKLARRLSRELYLRNVTRTLQRFDDHISPTSVCAAVRSNTPCAMAGAGWQHARRWQIGPGARHVTLP